MKSVIFGGTAGLGRSISEALAEKGHELVIVFSSLEDVESLKSDLSIRFGVKCEGIEFDLNSFENFENYKNLFNGVENLFLIAGFFDEEDTLPLNTSNIEKTINVNFASPVKIVNKIFEYSGTSLKNIVGTGSIASIRPRKKSLCYGASKTGLEFFFNSLYLSLFSTQCKIQYYRLGYMATGMTFGKSLLLPSVSTDLVAKKILNGLSKNRLATYLPFWWKPIALVLKIIPMFIFRRLNF